MAGFGDDIFDRMVADCLSPGFGGEAALRVVSKQPTSAPRRGFQFCFLVRKRSGTGATALDWELWSLSVDPDGVVDAEAGERLLHAWSHFPKSQPTGEIHPHAPEAHRAALAEAEARLAALDRDDGAPMYDLLLLAVAEVHVPE